MEKDSERDRIYLGCVIDTKFFASARGSIVLGPAGAKGSTGVSSPAAPFHLSIVYERFICRVHDFARARARTLPLVQKRDLRELPDCPRSASRPPPKESESWYTQELNMIAKVNWLTVPITAESTFPRTFPRRILFAKYTGDGTEYSRKRQEPQVSSRLAECRGTRRR